MARIAYFDLAQAPDAYRALLGERPPLNLYRMLPHAGDAAIGFLTLGGALLRRSELDPRLREIAILRVGMISGAGYEVHQHKRVARNAGLAPEKIAALTREPSAPGCSGVSASKRPGALIDPDDLAVFDDVERFVIAFTDQVVHHVKVDDAMFAAARERLGMRALHELVLTIGFYMMVSRYLENFEVDIETPA
jgi:alkylhydroperoxidase family enzyme